MEALQSKLAVLLASILLLSIPTGMVSGQSSVIRECEILVDWDYEISWLEEPDEEGQFFSHGYVHRYRVVFNPEFSPGSSPSGVSVDATHVGLDREISALNVSYISAGGEVDIELDSQPFFGDKIFVNFSSLESTCDRSVTCLLYTSPSPRDGW